MGGIIKGIEEFRVVTTKQKQKGIDIRKFRKFCLGHSKQTHTFNSSFN